MRNLFSAASRWQYFAEDQTMPLTFNQEGREKVSHAKLTGGRLAEGENMQEEEEEGQPKTCV